MRFCRAVLAELQPVPIIIRSQLSSMRVFAWRRLITSVTNVT